MNAQIYSFDPACQTECDGDEIFLEKLEEWNVGKME
jgi:hypothetical protein